MIFTNKKMTDPPWVPSLELSPVPLAQPLLQATYVNKDFTLTVITEAEVLAFEERVWNRPLPANKRFYYRFSYPVPEAYRPLVLKHTAANHLDRRWYGNDTILAHGVYRLKHEERIMWVDHRVGQCTLYYHTNSIVDSYTQPLDGWLNILVVDLLRSYAPASELLNEITTYNYIGPCGAGSADAVQYQSSTHLWRRRRAGHRNIAQLPDITLPGYTSIISSALSFNHLATLQLWISTYLTKIKARALDDAPYCPPLSYYLVTSAAITPAWDRTLVSESKLCGMGRAWLADLIAFTRADKEQYGSRYQYYHCKYWVNLDGNNYQLGWRLPLRLWVQDQVLPLYELDTTCARSPVHLFMQLQGIKERETKRTADSTLYNRYVVILPTTCLLGSGEILDVVNAWPRDECRHAGTVMVLVGPQIPRLQYDRQVHFTLPDTAYETYDMQQARFHSEWSARQDSPRPDKAIVATKSTPTRTDRAVPTDDKSSSGNYMVVKWIFLAVIIGLSLYFFWSTLVYGPLFFVAWLVTWLLGKFTRTDN